MFLAFSDLLWRRFSCQAVVWCRSLSILPDLLFSGLGACAVSVPLHAAEPRRAMWPGAFVCFPGDPQCLGVVSACGFGLFSVHVLLTEPSVHFETIEFTEKSQRQNKGTVLSPDQLDNKLCEAAISSPQNPVTCSLLSKGVLQQDRSGKISTDTSPLILRFHSGSPVVSVLSCMAEASR